MVRLISSRLGKNVSNSGGFEADVTDAIDTTGDITSTGAITSESVAVSGPVTAESLNVSGPVDLDNDVVVDGTLTVAGATTLNTDVAVNAGLNAHWINTAGPGANTLNNVTNINNSLTVNGTATVEGATLVNDNLTVTGTSTLGSVTISSSSINAGFLGLIGGAQLGGRLNGAKDIRAQGEVSIIAKGSYLQHNRDGTNEETFLVNQKGTGAGGFRLGKSDTSNNFTTQVSIDSSGKLHALYGLGVVGATSIDGDLNVTGAITGDTVGNDTFTSLQVGFPKAINSQGGFLQWNRAGGGPNGNSGRTFLINQKGLGTGGISLGFSDTSDNYTEYVNIDEGGRLNPKAGLTVTGQTVNLTGATAYQFPGASVSFKKIYHGICVIDYDTMVKNVTMIAQWGDVTFFTVPGYNNNWAMALDMQFPTFADNNDYLFFGGVSTTGDHSANFNSTNDSYNVWLTGKTTIGGRLIIAPNADYVEGVRYYVSINCMLI